ncbi:N-acetylglucosamine kinase [Angustibacter sp. McL0619]|uniref:N-acetylglucosamine kinase n=1 Tax=Angustibacter sp. McL0619 TaxID=3415676 RepID=UPI003CF15D76
MADLVLGLDGGNSKTDVVLADSTGRVLAHERGPGTRSHVDGVDTMVDGLAVLVDQVRASAGVPASEPVTVGAFYLANLDLPEAEREAQRAIAARGLAQQVVVGNDTLAVLHAGALDGWGVAVVSGAGINAIGVDPEGGVARFLALGEMTGDWGGGWAVSVTGIGAAVRAGDGRGPATLLGERLAKHFGRASVEQVAIEVADGTIGQHDVITAAPVVFSAAVDGDDVAVGIVYRLADEVVEFALAAVNRLRLNDIEVPVVLGGGTLQHGPALLLDRITDQLARQVPRARPRVLDVPPVAGALLSALASCGAAPDVLVRARAALATP